MRLENKELINEFYARVQPQFANLTVEDLTAVCHTPYQFLRNCIEGDEITKIRLKYFGTFEVYPGRARNCLYNIEEKFKNKKIDVLQYKRMSEMIGNYLNKLENEEL